MNILLAAVNAKYIHSNLGIYSLKAYGEKRLSEWRCDAEIRISLAEYTINHQRERILQDLYKREPDVIGFSCYIWNISWVKALLEDIKKILPQTRIWLGGPEVSYDAERALLENPAAELVMKGEGEETFAQLLRLLTRPREEQEIGLEQISGLAFRRGSRVLDTGLRPPMNMDEIPFPYAGIALNTLEHRIIYYESSRGCPFSCAYCLSSIDRRVRFRSPALVKEELSWFLRAGVPQVKFVDRTFNCRKEHAMELWRFLRDHDNGKTNFHFEIAADLLDEEELSLLRTMRPGLIQLEIGVQSTNKKTLEAIRRRTDLDRIRTAVGRINSWHTIHQHLDLIAGLPWEDLESFRRSFNQVYEMEPEQLQLGFLKVLKGSYMEQLTAECDLRYSGVPPYEVLSTRWLSYRDVLELKRIEEMTEVYYNSRQFTCTIRALEQDFPSPYAMFLALADWYEAHGLFDVSHSRLARYEILWEMTEGLGAEKRERYRDLLICDLYLRENSKSRPSFARDQGAFRDASRAFFDGEEASPHYLKDYEGYDARQMARMAHLEQMGDGSYVLFDYRRRDPLSGNARMTVVEMPPRGRRD